MSKQSVDMNSDEFKENSAFVERLFPAEKDLEKEAEEAAIREREMWRVFRLLSPRHQRMVIDMATELIIPAKK